MAFRPFFLLYSFTVAFVPMYLVTVVINDYPFPNKFFDIITWHGHELLFGGIPALLAGFLLTASTHWTGQKTISPLSLSFLILLWLITRVIVWIQPNEALIFIIAPTFTLYLLFKMMLVLKGNDNQKILSGILSLLLCAQVFYLYTHLYQKGENSQRAIGLALFAIFLLVSTFSGRLIPFFTNSRFKKILITLNPNIEKICFFSTLLTFLIYSFSSAYLLNSVLFFILSIVYILRTINLFTSRLLKETMLLPLFLAHCWLPIFAILKSIEIYFQFNTVGQAALHALMTGAVGLFSLSIMTRASLGHTGREIKASTALKIAFSLVFVGAILRVFVPLFNHDVFNRFLHVSMGVWTLGFIIYFFKFLPIHLQKRVEES